MNRSIVALAAALSFLTLEGCTDIKPLQADVDALKSQVGKLQSEVSAVKASAESATRAANAAKSSASQAAMAASGAQSTANRALSVAQAAQQSANALSEKVDRMFRKRTVTKKSVSKRALEASRKNRLAADASGLRFGR